MTIRSRTVDTTPTLGSLLLGSSDPTRLRDWYEKAFGVAVDTFGFHSFGGFGLMPDQRDDVAGSAAEPGRVILNFDVPDARAAVERIERAGTTWIMPLTENPEGTFATFTDPDGNYLQVIEMSHDMQQQMLAGYRDEWRNTKPFSGIAVDDTAAAKEFYSTVMDLDVTEKYGILALWLDARSCVLAYPKPHHVPAQHTVLNFPVDDIDTAVDDLVAAGVIMLRYDGMKQDAKGIMREGGPLIAWFADPAGNILSYCRTSERIAPMRFLMLIHDNPTRWEHPTFAHHDGTEPSEIAALQQQFDELLTELTESGEYVSGYPLADPALTRSVLVRGDEVLVSDGPHAEAKEQLAGYFVVDCESWQRAEDIAARFPSTRFGPIEIRPVMVSSGNEW